MRCKLYQIETTSKKRENSSCIAVMTQMISMKEVHVVRSGFNTMKTDLRTAKNSYPQMLNIISQKTCMTKHSG